MVIWVYGGCGTCRKALAWLRARGVEVEVVDLVVTPPTAEVLRGLHARSGRPLAHFFNTSGQSYRNGGFKDRLGTMSEDEQLAALAADGMLVKRPILDLGGRVLVGFREAEWNEALS